MPRSARLASLSRLPWFYLSLYLLLCLSLLMAHVHPPRMSPCADNDTRATFVASRCLHLNLLRSAVLSPSPTATEMGTKRLPNSQCHDPTCTFAHHRSVVHHLTHSSTSSPPVLRSLTRRTAHPFPARNAWRSAIARRRTSYAAQAIALVAVRLQPLSERPQRTDRQRRRRRIHPDLRPLQLLETCRLSIDALN
jgi:hypothetical protein